MIVKLVVIVKKILDMFNKEIPNLDEKIGIVRRKTILRVLKDGRQK